MSIFRYDIFKFNFLRTWQLIPLKQLSEGRESPEAFGASLPSDLMMDQRTTKPSRSVTTGSDEFLEGRKTMDTKKVRGPDSPLYNAICPVVYIIRVFGLAPYEFHNDILVPSRIHSIFAYICLIAYTCIITHSVMSRFTRNHEQPLLGHTEAVKVSLRRRYREIPR